MYLACFPQLPAMLALGHWTAFFLDLEQGTVGVFAGGRAVAFDTSFAVIVLGSQQRTA